MFFLYAAALALVSVALALTLIEALRFKQAWKGWIAIFLGALWLQNLIASFEAFGLGLALRGQWLGVLQENLAYLNFGLFVLPLILGFDLAYRGRVLKPRLIIFIAALVFGFVFSLIVPGFWLSPKPGLISLLGYLCLALTLGIYLWSLIDALLRDRRKGLPGMRMVLILLLVRFGYETVLNIFSERIAVWILSAHGPAFALLLGALLCLRFFIRATQAYGDPRVAVLSPDFIREYGLSAREREVLELLCLGLDTKDIAERLFLSVKTVNSHLHNTYAKCGVSGRTQLLTRLKQVGTETLGNLPNLP